MITFIIITVLIFCIILIIHSIISIKKKNKSVNTIKNYGMKNYVALDVETANSNRNSICSISIIKFVDGKPTTYISTLINPVCTFNSSNVNIHKISSNMVVNSPTWDVAYPELTEFIGNNTIVAHNARFDFDCFTKMTQQYNLPLITNNWVCTLKSSRRVLNLQSNKLPAVAKHLKINGLKHHNAHSDALVCGKIASYISDEEMDSIIITKSDIKAKQVKYSNVSANLEKYHSLTEHNIVFTGTMNAFSREEAKNFVTALGGKCPAAIGKKTTILVTGPGAGPAKLKTASEQGILVISEQKFFDLITKSENNT